MKVVIQNPVTHHFLDSTNHWKSSIKEARFFASTAEAALFASHNIDKPYNVVLKFDDPRYDFAVLAGENPNHEQAASGEV